MGTISQQRQELRKQQLRLLVVERAAKKRAPIADKKSVLTSKDEVLARVEVNTRLDDQIVTRERLSCLQDNS